MRKILTNSFLAFILLFSFGEIKAEENPAIKDATTVVILTPQRRKNPKMPARIFLECRYTQGHIWFTFPDGTQWLEATISDGEILIWQGTVTRQNPDIEIPSLSGEYSLSCRTDGNQIFQGELTF